MGIFISCWTEKKASVPSSFSLGKLGGTSYLKPNGIALLRFLPCEIEGVLWITVPSVVYTDCPTKEFWNAMLFVCSFVSKKRKGHRKGHNSYLAFHTLALTSSKEIMAVLCPSPHFTVNYRNRCWHPCVCVGFYIMPHWVIKKKKNIFAFTAVTRWWIVFKFFFRVVRLCVGWFLFLFFKLCKTSSLFTTESICMSQTFWGAPSAYLGQCYEDSRPT